ncbi:MAG: hypothetical protein RIS70_735, partial [Planctomycetota bacterium]
MFCLPSVIFQQPVKFLGCNKQLVGMRQVQRPSGANDQSSVTPPNSMRSAQHAKQA